MKRMLALIAALLFAAGAGAGYAADQATPKPATPAPKKAHAAQQKTRVVIQVSDADPRGWAQALNYTENLQETLGKDKVEIELVALGQGIGILKLDSPHATRVAEALRRDVKITACEISMRRQKLGREDMLSDIGYVPAGLVEIITRQKQGWHYIKG